MSEPQWIWRSEHVVPSNCGAGCDAIHEVLYKLEQSGWNDNDIFSVQLAMEEAVTNAVKHGNRMNRKKKVRIAANLAEDLIRVEISDEGAGFDPHNLPDPTEEPHCNRPCGRGVMLMRNFMNNVEFNDKGNGVIMEKCRGKSAQQGA